MCDPCLHAEGTASQEGLSPRQNARTRENPVFLAVFPVPELWGCVWCWLGAVTLIPHHQEDLSVPRGDSDAPSPGDTRLRSWPRPESPHGWGRVAQRTGTRWGGGAARSPSVPSRQPRAPCSPHDIQMPYSPHDSPSTPSTTATNPPFPS